MKTFIRTIIVFLALNLATGSFAVDVAETVKRNVDAAQKAVETARRQAEDAQKTKTATAEVLRTLTLAQKPPLYSSARRVLVIPAAEIKAQDLITIMEDMSVMSRIFDKKLDLSPGGIFRGGYGGGGYGGGGYGGGGMGGFGGHILSPEFFGRSGSVIEGIYLDGYGALFLMKVNFPLSPPAKVQEKKIEEPADPIWEQTKREIYTPEDVGRRRMAPAAKYDVEKVDELKNKLIKALKHAANIRNLKPSESIIITVTGEGDQVSGTIRLLVKRSTIDADVEDKEVEIYGPPFSDEMGFSSPAVMTIRTKKSDADAFAKADLDFEQFRKKVQIFTY